VGRSQFDYLVGANPLPFPFSRLVARIEAHLAQPAGGLSPLKITLIPLGRSLQRAASAPDFFRYPRVVLAVDGASKPGALALKDRLFIGYNEKAAVLEVISYNESAGRFEFQVVHDYRPGGQPKIVYARREICLACHQNQAPIFARPLWDETPANPAIAARLQAVGRDFYGVKLSGTDIAYFIDASSARASMIPVWQSIWDAGCGPGADGERCRRALFLAALRYGLSGVLPGQPGEAENMLERRWTQAWPQGLAIPNSNIPNRDPLAFVPEAGESPKQSGVAPELARLAHVPAQFEPLRPRPPLELWQQPDKAHLIAGLADLIDQSDKKLLDAQLRADQAPTQKISLDCRFTRKENGQRVAFACASARAKLSGAWQLHRGKASGSVDEIALAGAVAPPAMALEDSAPRAGLTRFRLYRAGLRARLADGRLLEQLELAPSASDIGTATLVLRDDISLVQTKVAQLPAAAGVFQARQWMGQLLPALGIRYPVMPASKLPAPQAQEPSRSAAGAAKRPGIQAGFERFCGQCHDSGERFPPNFLHGDATAVAAQIDHCAERIFYRLSMWNVQEAQRGKTPMPPVAALTQHGFDAQSWTRAPELAALRRYVEQLLLRTENPQRVLAQSFEHLRECLPAAP
jgi:cytochrome c5